MRVVLFLALAGILWSGAVLAEESVPPECRILPEHKASDDVVYQPGVDINGKAVAPADLNAAPMGTEQTIVVPLTVDLAKRLQSQHIEGLNLEGTLGFLEIRPGGRVTYNGQDLTSQLYVLCGKKPMDALEYAPVKEKEDHEQSTSPAASQKAHDGDHANPQ